MDKSGEKPKKERKTRKKKSPQNKTKKIYQSGPRLNEKILVIWINWMKYQM